MNTTKPFDATKIACDLLGWLQEAVGDMAADMTSQGSGFLDDKWDKRIKTAKKAKVRDIVGWLADELYNDADTVSDLLGDKVYDACPGGLMQRAAVYNELVRMGHRAVRTACAKQLQADLDNLHVNPDTNRY